MNKLFHGRETHAHQVIRLHNTETMSLYTRQCWEGYFVNVIGYRLQVTLFKM